ncbi:MAG: response regulator, partial [Proteobacteria bacterium]
MATVSTQHLQIGGIILAEDDALISTVLGSCVSVCIFSRKHKAGAINHFALPTFDYVNALPNDGDQFCFGDRSIPHMIAEFLRVTGATVSDLEAKVIGGASVLLKNEASRIVGPVNISLAREMLAAAGIPIVGEDVGGIKGRKVQFYPATGRVRVAPIKDELIAASKNPEGMRKPRVLVVDDSKTIRDLLKRILTDGDELEVVGFAENPLIAEKMIQTLKPDVITLDIYMPEMDGITFLEQYLPKNPLPVVLITSISLDDGGKVLRGLEMGAVDYIQKPSLHTMAANAPMIREKVKQ